MDYDPSIQIKAKIQFKEVLFGLTWNPFSKVELAVSGTNGLLQVYNLEHSNEKPVQKLKGHSGKVADIAWNPHYNSVLASTADDKTVRVWDTNANEQISLSGHTQHTRGISWNYELPWLLLSGSWDSTIRIWDLRTHKTIYVINDHIADVYGIVSHPERPFVYASCSRDTTIRIWRLDGFMHSILLRLAFRKDVEYIRQDAPSLSNLLYEQVKSQDLSLCGQQSKNIVNLINDAGLYQKASKSRELMNYLGVYDGLSQLFSIVETILQGYPSVQNARIVHLTELVSVSKSRIEELESSSNMPYLGTNFAKKEDRLLECARILLEIGDYRKYCNIMVEIGHYDQALAIAPAVSLSFWRDIALRVAEIKGSSQLEEPAQYFQIANDIDRAVLHLKNSQKYQNAKLIKALHSNNLLQNAAIELIKSEKEDHKNLHSPEAVINGFQKDQSLKELVNTQASALFGRGQQILAAAAHLAINDTTACLAKLVRANELYIALAISKLMKHPAEKEISLQLAERAERLKLNKLAAQIYKEMKEPKKLALLVKRLRDTDDPASVFLTNEYKIDSAQNFKIKAKTQDPAFSSHVFNLIMGGELNAAALKVVTLAKEVLLSSDPKHIELVLEVFDILQEVRIISISETNLKAEVLLYSAAIGALKAVYLGLFKIVPCLVGAIFSISEHQKIKPVFDLQIFQILEQTVAQASAQSFKISPQFSIQSQKKQYEVLMKSVENYYSKKSELMKRGFGDYQSIGSNLPVNSKLKHLKSIFTGEIIRVSGKQLSGSSLCSGRWNFFHEHRRGVGMGESEQIFSLEQWMPDKPILKGIQLLIKR